VRGAGGGARPTHGSGDTNAGLAAAVDAVELVLADGSVRIIERGAADFGGAVVSLGALGVVSRLRLRTEPTFDVEQTVYRGLPIHTAAEHLDDVMALAYSVSLFTDWHSGFVDQVWVKRRVDTDPAVPTDVHGARPSTTTVHPLAAMSSEACTAQLGVQGPWHARLPHFRLEFTPSGGEELQSEFFVERRHARAAVRAVAEIGHLLAPQLLVSEVRSVAADDQWMSTTSGADHLALHFTWRLDPVGVAQLLPTLEAALDPFDARPHWGKITTMAPSTVRGRFPALPRFVELADRLDPGRAFRTPYLMDLIGG
jgi:xylitol oxidase